MLCRKQDHSTCIAVHSFQRRKQDLYSAAIAGTVLCVEWTAELMTRMLLRDIITNRKMNCGFLVADVYFWKVRGGVSTCLSRWEGSNSASLFPGYPHC